MKLFSRSFLERRVPAAMGETGPGVGRPSRAGARLRVLQRDAVLRDWIQSSGLGPATLAWERRGSRRYELALTEKGLRFTEHHPKTNLGLNAFFPIANNWHTPVFSFSTSMRSTTSMVAEHNIESLVATHFPRLTAEQIEASLKAHLQLARIVTR
jgi:hypothetical protein